MNRLLILCLTLLASYSVAAQDSKCSKPGEYCLNHWDCCTKTCLSFLYKCSGIPKFASQSSVPVLQNRGSFLSEDSPSETSPDNTISYDALLDFIFTPMRIMSTALESNANSIKMRLDDTAEQVEATTQETKTEKDVILTTEGPQCKEIGSKCYFNEDCCTKLCHGYLHQCVT